MTPIRVCLAGTWDPGFHRNRTLRRLLDLSDCNVTICRVQLWEQRRHAMVQQGKLTFLLRALFVYPLLAWRFLKTPKPDVVIVPYPGHFDMPILTPLCRIRGIPVVFDIFISLYDTIVSDRRLAGRASPTGIASRLIDCLACRLADFILADTPPHADYFSRLTGVARNHFRILWLGAQEDVFRPRPGIEPDPDVVLFHGTFIPLQGLETIVRAAKKLEADRIRVRIVGDGQDRETVDRLISKLNVQNLERTGFLPLDQVPEEIAKAGVCLGIFGTTAKADRVVPNKLYECLSIGRPVITGDTAAVRCAFTPGKEVITVPPGDAESLAAAVRSLCRRSELRERIATAGHRRFQREYSQQSLAKLLRHHLEELLRTDEGDSTRPGLKQQQS